MGDWKKDLAKHQGNAAASGSAKKCEKCGKPLKDNKYKYCFSCNEELKTTDSKDLAVDYLQGGYFDETGNLYKRYVIKGGDADLIAKKLGDEKPAMTTHQLRRFYGHVRAAENRLKMTNDFDAVYIDLIKLDPFVAEAKGKGKIPDIFYNFISKNIAAVKSKKDFLNGFLEHFQAVVAYFIFHHPKK